MHTFSRELLPAVTLIAAQLVAIVGLLLFYLRMAKVL